MKKLIFVLLAVLGVLLVVSAHMDRYNPPRPGSKDSGKAPAQAQPPATHPESAAAKKVRERKEKDEKYVRETVQRLVRRAYAKSMQEQLWRDGIECKLSTTGPDETTLYLQYIFAGDAFRFQFGEKSVEPNAAALREMGFKKVQISDGYDYGWVWTL